jgi:glucuronoarabinoxylan endo-1,4-beta-xylanase
MKGNLENYAKYAAELTNAIALLRDKGVSVEALSVQNEPDMENSAYDTSRWTGQQIHDFVPVLSKALSVANFENVKIATPEQSTWDFDLLSPSLNDSAVADKIGIVFGHGYESNNPRGLPSIAGRRVWQTEVSNPKKFDGTMADALGWAQSIHNYLTIGANAWMYWNLACGKSYFNQTNNMCLTDHNNRLAKRAYVLGQYARFIRPGWQRIGVTNDGLLLVTAFRGPQNRFAIAAINTSNSSVPHQTFVLNGVSSHAEVTPWLTSNSASLQAKSPVPLVENGSSFTYTIPAQSVVTFQGRGD